MKASPGHIGRREFVRMKLCSVVVWLLAVLTCGTIAAQTTTRDQVHWVPMRDQDGAEHRLFTRICRPTGDAPAPVVLINHGSPPDADARPAMRPASCESEAVQWFLARGYLVVLGMRRGYGETTARPAVPGPRTSVRAAVRRAMQGLDSRAPATSMHW